MIKSTIGWCRAWLRLALNEEALTSYLSSLLTSSEHKTILNRYYDSFALFRDAEQVSSFALFPTLFLKWQLLQSTYIVSRPIFSCDICKGQKTLSLGSPVIHRCSTCGFEPRSKWQELLHQQWPSKLRTVVTVNKLIYPELPCQSCV